MAARNKSKAQDYAKMHNIPLVLDSYDGDVSFLCNITRACLSYFCFVYLVDLVKSPEIDAVYIAVS